MHDLLHRLRRIPFLHHNLQLNNMNQPPILNIKMVPDGVELVVMALSRLPYNQVAPLIGEIQGQAEYQKQQFQAAAQAAPVAAEAAPAPRRGGRPKGSKNKARRTRTVKAAPAPVTQPATPEGETQQ